MEFGEYMCEACTIKSGSMYHNHSALKWHDENERGKIMVHIQA